MERIFAITIIVVSIALSFACASKAPKPSVVIEVAIDSINSPSATNNKTYILLPGNRDTSVDDLQFKEYATYVERALGYQGFQKADSPETANCVIFLNYGIGDPVMLQRTYSVPVWGQTGVSSSTSGTFTPNYSGSISYNATTSNTPQYGITGFQQRTENYTMYSRFILLDAFDFSAYKTDNKSIPLWKTTVTSQGSSGDLRFVFPYLVAASRQYISANTGKMINLAIDDNSQTLKEVMGIKSNP